MGLDYLWKCGIAHGGGYILAYWEWRLLIIVRFTLEKVLFTAPSLSQLSGGQIMSRFGKPTTGAVRRRDGQNCPRSMPSYLVEPLFIKGHDAGAKVIDLGNGILEPVNAVDQN